MKEIWFYICAVTIIVLITVTFIIFPEKDKNIAFLKKYGWETEDGFIEREEIVIPTEFDDVYLNYNEIQKESGLDITPYKGKRAVRYTYIIKNYPNKEYNNVRANVICVDGKPIAGDIMTVGLNGFMHSLSK